MKKEKRMVVILSIILVLLILTAGIILVVALKQNPKSEQDINQLNTEMIAKGSFENARMQDITLSNLQDIFSISPDDVTAVIGKIPLLNISSSMYIVIQAKEGKASQIEAQLTAYGNRYETEWSSYMEDQYLLVKNRKIGIIDDYVYLLVSDTADDMESLLKK